MSLLRRLFGGKPQTRRGPRAVRAAPPGALLDLLEGERAEAEADLLRAHHECPECGSNYLRVGAWAKGSEAGWTVTCVNCGHLLERSVELVVR